MKTLFTAEAISKGGRSGTIETPDQLLNITLGNPLELGAEKLGPNPELLFAAAYSACFHGAVRGAAKKLGTPVADSIVRALVSLLEDDDGGYHLAVSCGHTSPTRIVLRCSASWKKRTKPVPIPKRCVATPASP